MNEVEIRVTTKDDTARGAAAIESRMRKIGKQAEASLGAAGNEGGEKFSKGLKDGAEKGAKAAESRIGKIGKMAAGALAAGGAAAGAVFAKGMADNLNIEVANDKLAGQLALSTEDAKKAGEMAGNVYGQNWGESIDEVNEAIRSVDTNISAVGATSKKEFEGMTTDALALKQTFDMDLAKSTEAVGMMIKNGLAKNATEAFDIITAGAQNGVNKADDLLETFQEYSPQFSKLGIDGKDALNLLSAGLQAGARDTDVIADGFKELSIRAVDGTTLTAQGFKDIGLNAKDMAREFGKGGEAARDATQKTMEGLLAIKDPIKQNIAGTALFGTQWEDTIRKILPALANADEEIQIVDGSTKTLADTVGNNAQGRIDTLKRGFEQWTQKMAGSSTELGTTVTALVEFGPAAATAAAGLLQSAAAMRALNVAMLMNPIGLTVAAIAALVAGLVILYMKSEAAREVMQKVFSAIAGQVLLLVEISLKGFKIMANGFMELANQILTAATYAWGWVPGLGDKLKNAKKSFDGFKEGVNNALDEAIDKTVEWKDSVNRMPKEVKLKGDIRDLNAKVANAKRVLNTVPKERKPAIRAEISQLYERVRAAKLALAQLRNKTVYVTMQQINAGYAGNSATGGKASGGYFGQGAATGGVRRGLTMVGEYGRELVDLTAGRVYNNGETEKMMAGAQAGGSAETVVRIELDGTGLLQGLRKTIRVRGGSVQTVLGT